MSVICSTVPVSSVPIGPCCVIGRSLVFVLCHWPVVGLPVVSLAGCWSLCHWLVVGLPVVSLAFLLCHWLVVGLPVVIGWSLVLVSSLAFLSLAGRWSSCHWSFLLLLASLANQLEIEHHNFTLCCTHSKTVRRINW